MPSRNVQDSLCVRLLRCLDAPQQAGFLAYLECSLFNTNGSVLKVYQVLCTKALAEPGTPLTPHDLLAGSGIRPELFDKYAAQLVGHLEQFVPFWEQKDDPRHGFADAFKAWEKMGLEPELLERQYRKMKRKARRLPPSEWMWIQNFELEHRYFQYRSSRPRKDQAALFEATEASLSHMLQVMQLRYYCARYSLRRFLAMDIAPPPSILDDIVPEQLPPLGQAYYRAAQQLESSRPDPASTQAHFQWLLQHRPQFSQADQEDLFGFLLNTCLQHAQQNPAFSQLLDAVYTEMAAYKLLGNEQQLPGSHFKNMVSLKIKLGQLEAADRFIDQYRSELSREDQAVLVPYTRGLVAYHSRQFEAAILQFKRVLAEQLLDVYWGLEARLMLWRSYYEMLEALGPDDYADFLRMYDALRIYLARRNHLSAQQKEGYENFIRIFNRLARIKEEPVSLAKLRELRQEFTSLDNIRQKAWLAEIIDQKLQAFDLEEQ